MKKKKTYFDWVDEYPNYVVLRKEGWLFRAKEESADVLSAVTGYQIMERENGIREAGSGKEQLETMVYKLSQKHINYVVIHFDEVIDEECFEDNKYRLYV